MDLRCPLSSAGPVTVFTYEGVDYSLLATPVLQQSVSATRRDENVSMYTTTSVSRDAASTVDDDDVSAPDGSDDGMPD